MGLRVNSNIISLAAQRHLSTTTMRLESNFKRLASGLRIASGSDDPAGLGISERMRAQLRSLSQAARNGQDGVSLVQTAEGALNEVNNSLARMRELAIQSANGTLSSGDRQTLDLEFQALITEVDRIANTTNFNGTALLDGAGGSVAIQIGTEQNEVISINLVDTTTVGLGLASAGGSLIALSTAASAVSSLAVIDTAINSITTVRGDLGAAQNRMESAIRSIGNAEQNLAAAESRIRDVDVARETADLTRNSILQQAAVSILGQANAQPQIALSLLQG